MLFLLATQTGRTAEAGVPERAVTLWRTALDSGLPAGALSGAGRFATADVIDQDTWLELTTATIDRQPGLSDTRPVAQRAARSPAPHRPAHRRDHPQPRLCRRPPPQAGHLARGQPVCREPGRRQPRAEALRVALINAGAIEDA
ncbi:hypothetical protein E4N62_45365 [Streptomyces sp. MNU76]|uniref:hypothetical protein n=1 Tax=Streptomyces sp. MNU76 TaxID=2560026 RepID=UPI001E408B29|nr:hypothetical protein [Streptomyces sp. MNU76]MCC9711816.1 hypothetical protein [Streptomyces sp. MNU76]